MELDGYTLTYKLQATDEFNRSFETYGTAEARYLIIKESADSLYLQMMMALVSPILFRMGTDANAEWSVEVTEKF